MQDQESPRTGWEEWAAVADGPRFAHPSERFLSRIFDLCRLHWHYEPRTFVLRRNADGGIAEGFTPDFFLPEVDLYLEVTTMRQDLTTRKHKKLRRLRELYSSVRVHILHRRDCEALRRMVVRGRVPRTQVRRALELISGGPPMEELVTRAAYHTRVERVVDTLGDIRLHNQMLHAHGSLAGQRVLVWIYADHLEIEHGGKVVAVYRSRYDSEKRRVGRATRPRHYAAGLPRQRRLPALPAPRSTARPLDAPSRRRGHAAGPQQLALTLE